MERLELLAFHTIFDLQKRMGELPINTSFINKEDFQKALGAAREVFKAGICVSELVATAAAGQRLGSVIVPAGKIGFSTVCSLVVNRVLLKAGIPIESRFGGVLEVKDGKPKRITTLIN